MRHQPKCSAFSLLVTRALWHVAVVLLALSAICGLGSIVVAFRSDNAGSGLTVQSASVGLGAVEQGAIVPVLFKLVNHTASPIRILGAEEP